MKDTDLLRPEVVGQISRMEIRARRLVEGYVTGRHRSPYKGTSIEFAQHREYVPGDDPRHLDWKVYARSDRYYVKEYEEETNLCSYLLLDGSESMRYGSGEGESKYSYAAAALAALAYLLLRQQDQVSLGIFDSEVRESVPLSSHPGTLVRILTAMATSAPRARTDLEELFHRLAEEWTRRGIVVIASDLFDRHGKVASGLAHLRHAGHEVLVLHVLDPAERTFPFEGNVLFRGLEAMPELLVDPRALRSGYLNALQRFLNSLRETCARETMDLVPLTVGDPLGGVLAAYLARRQSQGRGARR